MPKVRPFPGIMCGMMIKKRKPLTWSQKQSIYAHDIGNKLAYIDIFYSEGKINKTGC